ncbi:hypothetical protein DY000_02046740 [Brassica cretica]|uniref:Uncharacterized protein n=1 Tax=Brassica cretica TaxID=69181 RepID=A0ABQ7F4T1_BRACR|nr:hypothetical protein DY000_02046740 [Brassica cretica]
MQSAYVRLGFKVSSCYRVANVLNAEIVACWSGLRSSIANGSRQLSGRVEQAEIVSRERAEVASWGTDRDRKSA